MALTNIFNEPRREITESAIGLLLVGGYLTMAITVFPFISKPTAGHLNALGQ